MLPYHFSVFASLNVLFIYTVAVGFSIFLILFSYQIFTDIFL